MRCVQVIAEIGISHLGNIYELMHMTEELQCIGVNHVKVQVFNRHPVLREKLGNFLLTDQELLDWTTEFPSMHLGASVFSSDDAKFAYHDLDLDFIKVPSGRTMNHSLLKTIRRFKNCTRIMSTGMIDSENIHQAFKVLKPHILLHCISQYPPPKCAAALVRIEDMWDDYKCEIGWSDHYPGIEMCIAAVARGAWVIEKHYGASGPDRAVASDKHEMSELLVALEGLRDAVEGERVITDQETELLEQIQKIDEGVE